MHYDFRKGDFMINSKNIFEDSLYVVSSTCRGEFDGTIKFKNKKTGIEHSSSSTCPVVINKLNGKYYITNTLAHLSGFSEILEIDNPDLLNNGSKLTNGTKRLLDSIGVLTLASFPYNGQLYHIITDFKKTSLAKIENTKFVTIETICDKSIWTYDPVVVRKLDGHLIVYFKNEEVKGVLDIFENQITVRRKR